MNAHGCLSLIIVCFLLTVLVHSCSSLNNTVIIIRNKDPATVKEESGETGETGEGLLRPADGQSNANPAPEYPSPFKTPSAGGSNAKPAVILARFVRGFHDRPVFDENNREMTLEEVYGKEWAERVRLAVKTADKVLD